MQHANSQSLLGLNIYNVNDYI